MASLDAARVALRAKRAELLNQLNAVDKALAALSSSTVLATIPETLSQAMAERATHPGPPIRLKPAKILTDEHKHALREGRRKAHHSKAVTAGLARERPDPSPGLTPSSKTGQRPRLVKRPKP